MRSKHSLLMKFGQLRSYSKRNNLIKKFYKNSSLKTSSRPFCICKELSITSIVKWGFWSNLLTLDTFPQVWNPLFSERSPISDANLKNYPLLSESHPNWCMQIVWNTLKWRCYISYYTKSIENIINITLFTFRLNSVFTTDTSFG